ncbi:NAD(P)H-dependent oxidoreductase [Phenylobacterium sp.]|jgi:chromate reductase, NAD(P)H dehydrogenase (quinone)|uniref:NADPH-dependent FMN reductase n=1 Tax=Phenylobacterium sp. TaxID=1871053 RepID=UPI001219FC48|nr:NAD(P)H-dependent oxidoreductase [Phenylobacterium sp.]THD63312.1 MAG: NADPH-dependent oxidoreductase [Phenylobacterium sp.]
MSKARTVAVIVGSLRKESFSRKLAKAFTAAAPTHLKFDFVDIGQLQFFNQDLESTPPAEWTAFRDRIRAADAVLFVTPEYNRGIPGVLKNAIDVGSRPYGQSVWNGKPAAVVSNSPGAIGGFGAYHHLRQSLVFLNMPTVNQPETYVGGVASMFDEAGELTNEATREFLTGFGQVFADGIEKHLS